MTLFILGLVLFIGTHSIYILAPAFRQAAVNRIGYNPWRGLYSLVSLAGLVVIVYGYGAARLDPVEIWSPPFWTRHLAMTLGVLVFPVLTAAFIPGRIRAALKHPMLAAVTIWALVHLVANGTIADVLLFGVFLVWSVAARASLLGRPMNPLPSAAGRPLTNDILVVAIGLAVYAIFLFGLHEYIIGMPLL
jgi:uncharacterized membrane protein